MPRQPLDPGKTPFDICIEVIQKFVESSKRGPRRRRTLDLDDETPSVDYEDEAAMAVRILFAGLPFPSDVNHCQEAVAAVCRGASLFLRGSMRPEGLAALVVAFRLERGSTNAPVYDALLDRIADLRKAVERVHQEEMYEAAIPLAVDPKKDPRALARSMRSCMGVRSEITEILDILNGWDVGLPSDPRAIDAALARIEELDPAAAFWGSLKDRTNQQAFATLIETLKARRTAASNR
ncbi:MAG: hypothetical protein Q7R83_03410 [bacterium]|nr:hypothetical protein [bacterium]